MQNDLHRERFEFERKKHEAELRLAEARLKLESNKAGKLSVGVLTVIGAMIALASAGITASIGGYWQLQTERLKIQGQLEIERSRVQAEATRLQRVQQFQILLRATEGVDSEAAAQNLIFFVDIGYLEDPTKQIREFAEHGEAPRIPVADTSFVPRETSRIIIGADKSGIGIPEITVYEIRAHYIKLGWSGVGFHFIVMQSGEVVRFRHINEIPAVALGYNTGTIAIGLQVFEEPKQGGASYTKEQLDQLRGLMENLAHEYDIRPDSIYLVSQFRPINIGLDEKFLKELVSKLQ